MSKKQRPTRLPNEDGSVTVLLKEPLREGEELVEELKIQVPKAKHLKGVDLSNMNIDEILKLASKLTAYPPVILGELGMDDLFMVSEVIGDFLPAGDSAGRGL